MSRIASVLKRTSQPATESVDINQESFDETPMNITPEEQDVRDEIDTALDPIDADIMGISTLTDQTNQYQNVADVINVGLQEGGLSVEAAAIINIFAHKHGLNRVHVRVSNESAGTAPIYESKVALEGIKEFIAEWWEKLKGFLKTARQRFQAWLENAMNGAEGLQSAAEALKEKLANAQPGQGEIEFDKKSLLMIEGQFPNVGTEMVRFGNIAESVLVDALEDTYSSAENTARVLSGFKVGGEGSLNNMISVLAQVIQNPANSIAPELTETVESSVTESLLKGDDSLQVEIKASKPFLGNAQLAAAIVSVNQSENPIETLSALAKAMKFSKIEILDLTEENKIWNSHAEKTENNKVPRLSPSDIGKIADGAESVAKALLAMRRNAGKKAQLDRDIDAAGASVNNMGINESVEGGASLASSMRTIVSSIATYPSQVTGKLVSWFGTVSKTAIAYGNACLVGEKAEGDQPQQPTASN